jgi:hypothetical protein
LARRNQGGWLYYTPEISNVYVGSESESESGALQVAMSSPRITFTRHGQTASQGGLHTYGRASAGEGEEYCKEHRDSSHILLSYHLMTPGGCIPIG